MKNKAKAYISIYALSMFFVLVLAISFLLIISQNKRIENLYYENKIHAKTQAYSISNLLVNDESFLQAINSNISEKTFHIQELNKSIRVNFTRYDNNLFRANYNIEYPRRNKYSSMVNCKIEYKKKSFFEENLVDDDKINLCIEKFGKDKEKLSLDELVLFSYNNKTYFNSLDNINRIYEKWQTDNKEKISDNPDIKIDLKLFSDKSLEVKEKSIVDSKKIILLNDININGIFIDRDNIYQLDILSHDKKRVRVEGILLMINSDKDIYHVDGNYLTNQELSKNPNLNKKEIEGEYELILNSIRII